MTDDPKPSSGTPDEITGRVDKINRRVGKIVALCVTIVGAVITLTGLVKTSFDGFRHSPEDWTKCFHAQLICPGAVPLRQWESLDLELHLAGNNDCKATPIVYVAFTLEAGENKIRIDPTCSLKDSSCWEQRTLASGPFDWKVRPPKLIPLSDRLGHRVTVYINSFVYTVETKTQIRADAARFSLEDDPPPVNAGILGEALLQSASTDVKPRQTSAITPWLQASSRCAFLTASR
ncbi:MAG: hypothetical protein JF614_17175 [Acidobacteria bacterium]|nr:hypothetical protein [Acidobacteriota bacterium]